MSTAANYLTYLGISKHQKLPDSRLRFARRWKVEHHEYARASELEKYLFQPWGTPDGVLTGIDTQFICTPNMEDTHSNALLVDQYFDQERDGTESEEMLVLVKEYEILAPNVLTPAGRAVYGRSETGLLTYTEFFIARLDYNTSLLEQPGVSRGTAPGDLVRGKELYLGSIQDEDNHYAKIVTKVWEEPGILEAYKLFEDDLLYVTFISQGKRYTPTLFNAGDPPNDTLAGDPLVIFQGGGAATLFRDRIKNAEGFRRYHVTVMMKEDGTGLTSEDVVRSTQGWEEYPYPGWVDTTFASGILPKPGGTRSVKVQIEDRLNTTGNVGNKAPFSIAQGCWANVNFIPTETGLVESINKAFGQNYLAGSLGIVGSNATFMGMPVSSIAGGGGSSPTHAGFLAQTNPILSEKVVGDFTTDEGATWHRIRKVTLVGSFNDYYPLSDFTPAP